MNLSMEVHLEKQKEVGFVCHGHIKRVSMKHVPVRGANNAIVPEKKHKVNIDPFSYIGADLSVC